MAISDLSDIP